MEALKEAKASMFTPERGSVAEEFEKRGEERGEKRGRIEDKQQVLIRQLDRKFGLGADERSRIQATLDPEKLDAALDAVLFAESKAEVLAHLDENH